MSLPVVQLARLVGMVERVRVVELSGRPRGREWSLLVEGRGFRRLIDDGGAHRVFHPFSSAPLFPMRFVTPRAAARFAADAGLPLR